MADNSININAAIAKFNSARPEGAPRMTQQTLGKKIFGGEHDETRSGWYLSMWAKGKETTKLHPQHVRAICDTCGITPNTLFSYERTED